MIPITSVSRSGFWHHSEKLWRDNFDFKSGIHILFFLWLMLFWLCFTLLGFGMILLTRFLLCFFPILHLGFFILALPGFPLFFKFILAIQRSSKFFTFKNFFKICLISFTKRIKTAMDPKLRINTVIQVNISHPLMIGLLCLGKTRQKTQLMRWE